MRTLGLAWFMVLVGVAIAAAGGAVAWLGIVLWIAGFTLMAGAILAFWNGRSHGRTQSA